MTMLINGTFNLSKQLRQSGGWFGAQLVLVDTNKDNRLVNL